MSNILIKNLAGSFNFAASMLDKFIEICPEKAWTENLGSFPSWQHAYHAVDLVPFFLAPDGTLPKEFVYPMDVIMFNSFPDAPDKSKIAALSKEAVEYADNYFSSLADTDLSKPHAGFSSRINQEQTVIGAITGLIGHYYYHFGHCDAALRNNGVKGIF